MVAGAALYWAVILSGKSGMIRRPDFFAGSEYLEVTILITTTALFLTVFSKAFSSSRNRILLSTSALALLILNLILSLCSDVTQLGNIGTGLIMCIWGLHFTLISAEEAAGHVILTSFLTVIIYMGIMCLPPEPAFLTKEILILISALLSLVSSIIYNRKDTPPSDHADVALGGTLEAIRKPAALRFYASRLLLGFVIGVIMGLEEGMRSESDNGILIKVIAAIIAAAIVVMFLCQPNMQGKTYTYLPALPLLTTGLLVLPFVGSNIRILVQATLPTIWMSFILLSSAQLSTFKTKLGIADTQLSFSEKAVVKTSWTIGYALSVWAIPTLFAELAEVSIYVVMALSYGLTIAATVAMARLSHSQSHESGGSDAFGTIDQKGQRGQRDVPLPSPKAQLSMICDKIATQYSLTKREREVLEILAAGHSRPYIERALVISGSTAKTHIYRIYEKLGIQRKDGLLELVTQYREPESTDEGE
jgi:DNA-binding CsgD family transcriptional regulator